MRTTFSIDDDVLMAAKALARQQKKSVGAVLSALARQGLRRPAASAERNGIILLDRGPEAPMVVNSGGKVYHYTGLFASFIAAQKCTGPARPMDALDGR